ncbi:hypothetical protein PAMP_008362 [Pampus punctatissimus]
MSLSKEQLTAAASQQPRQPKCTRCRHHGIIVPQKGHVKFCPFTNCDCWKCYLITQRTRITTLQRNMNRAQKKEQRPGASGVTPAAERTSSSAAQTGGARPWATSGWTVGPRSSGAPESLANTTRTSHDVRSRITAGRERMAGLDSREMLPFVPNVAEEGPCTPLNALYFRELGQTAPLPVIHFPFSMSGHYTSTYAPCHNFLFGTPWLPPVPAELYNDGLHGPLMFPRFQPGAVHYPPPPEPGCRCRIQEPYQSEVPRQKGLHSDDVVTATSQMLQCM